MYAVLVTVRFYFSFEGNSINYLAELGKVVCLANVFKSKFIVAHGEVMQFSPWFDFH